MRFPRRKRPLKDERGQATFEFLLILPVFIGLVLLVVDLGLLMYSYVSVSNAVREGARYAAVGCAGSDPCDEAAVKGRTLDSASGFLNGDDVQVGWNPDGEKGSSVVVKAEGKYGFLFFPVSFPVVSCADMRVEQKNEAATGGGMTCE
jgi:hypothetical protein